MAKKLENIDTDEAKKECVKGDAQSNVAQELLRACVVHFPAPSGRSLWLVVELKLLELSVTASHCYEV